MMPQQKSIVLSIVNTELAAVVLARTDKSNNSHYFPTSDLIQAVKVLTDKHIDILSKRQGRTIVADTSQMRNYYTNLTHYFMGFCANPEKHETSVFDGFNDQYGKAIIITVKLMRADIMNSDATPIGE